MLRRDLLKAGLIAGATPSLFIPGRLFAIGNPADDDYADYRANPPEQPQPLGTHPATDEENQKALDICAAAKGNSLIELTDWFESLTEKNVDGHAYNAAWPDRWNPVIVQFYYATSLDHKQVYVKGDTIPWCAAYLNWALNRLGREGTGRADSGSFRSINGNGKGLGHETQQPVTGDLIVFKIRGANPDVGHGHVAIYLGETPAAYEVAGGNQYHGKKYSSINRTSIPKDGYILEKASFRDYKTIPTRSADT
ncbi:CHAP domain-containing protein [Caballeronia sordidicola]|uniref:CHAP domain-containing protein n=1 Tax=Caballeronia sordidicola TaxID=196367 RepID=UPI0004CFFD72|nr:CHAP domain-containing protein [Caballeronia sordidicola]